MTRPNLYHLIVASTMLCAGCATTTLPLVPIPVPIPRIAFLGGDDLDYSRRDWSDACRKLTERMREEYAYTALKGLDWEALSTELITRAESAESTKDRSAYYAALRYFVESLRDANIDLTIDSQILSGSCGSGFGLELTELDDGRALVSKLYEDGPAARAGVPSLAEVVAWDGKPVGDAIAESSMLWAGQPPATNDAQRAARLARLTRAPEGVEASLLLRVAGESDRLVKLTSYEQIWPPLEGDGLFHSLELETGAVLDSRDLGDGIGYVDVHRLSPTLTAPFPGRAFRLALESLEAGGAEGLIVDLRCNAGGLDEFAAEFASYFVAEPGPYRDLAVYQRKAQDFVVDEDLRVSLTAPPARITLPTLVLVDADTSGPAEMLAWTLQRLGVAKVVGASGTAGAAPVPDRTVDLPEGYRIIYPIARWIAPDGGTPVETTASGEGGVLPDIKAPLNEETLRARRGGDDPVLDFAKAELQAIIGTTRPAN